MAKTQWNDGNRHYLDGAFGATFFGITAGSGHTHKGTDNDGDCPKVNVADLDGYIGPTGDIAYGTIDRSYYGLTADISVQMRWQKWGDVITIDYPLTQTTGATSASYPGWIEIEPDGGTWPAALVTNTPDYLGMPFLVVNEDDFRAGMLVPPRQNNNNMAIYCSDSSGTIGTNFTCDDTTLKGFARQSVTYKTN